MDAIEHDDFGARLLGEVQCPQAITAAEAECRDVGIRRDECGGGRSGESAQQLPLQRPGFLEVVDVDVAELPRPGLRGVDGELEQAAVVDDAFECHDIGVDLRETTQGLPCGHARPLSHGIEIVRPQPEFACAREHRAHVIGEAECRGGCEQIGRPGHLPISDRTAQQITDARILLGAGEQAGHRGLGPRPGCPTHQRVGKAVECRHRRECARGHAPRKSSAHAAYRITIACEDEHAGRRHLRRPGELSGHGLDERRRGAGPRPTEHQAGARTAPGNDLLLSGVEGRHAKRLLRGEVQEGGGHGDIPSGGSDLGGLPG